MNKTPSAGFGTLSTLSLAPTPLKPISFEQFKAKIDREFIQESGIHPALYRAATRIVSDTESQFGEVSYPIHEALNWHLTRFGHQARANLSAVLLEQESGETWQAKLSNPRLDRKKTDKTGTPHYQKYDTPVGNGARAYLPPVPPELRQEIAQRYGVEVPMIGSFWDWLESHVEIAIVLTEGGKKGLSLLSGGEIAIALYGVNGGYRRLLDDSRQLIPDLQRFCQPGRHFQLAFDQDAVQKTRRRVNQAQRQLGLLLIDAGCTVTIAQWNGKLGKGIDDLIVSQGWQAWEQASAEALSLPHWQIWERLNHRLTWNPALTLTTADLSTLNPIELPEQGMSAIVSPKGTGKTKLIGSCVSKFEQVLAAGHRVALMRNLSARLGLDYRGDLDRVGGRLINGSAYSLRVGFCVDSLLAIDPETFKNCDLIIDEVVQVIRHLLTSGTCAKEGKRPALLARLRELIRTARRVIVADADLDNATLHYLQELRGDDTPIFLIRNDYQPEGYPARFIESSNRSAIVADLLSDVKLLPTGQAAFVATDSKGASKAIDRLLTKACPELRILLINAETSGGEFEQEFIRSPDAVLSRHKYDVILCSPSVGTGVSIEAQGAIAKVYGIFMGASSTDADMAQALGRVREPVERVVWCAKFGSNFSKVSRSTNALELKDHLYQRSSATVQLIRSSLREDVAGEISRYDWQSDPHLSLFCQIAAEQNFVMYHLRDTLLVRLRFEGNVVTVEDRQSDEALKSMLAIAKREQEEIDASAIANAPDLTYAEVLALEQKEGVSREDSIAISKFYLKEFYCLDLISLEDVQWDREGRRRGELLNLEAQLFSGVAVDRTVSALEKQSSWNQGHCPWDISGSELRRWLRSQLGMDELIAKMRSGWQWCGEELKPYAAIARTLAQQIKITLHFTITSDMSDTQVVHQLLSQLGIKLKMQWSRSHPGFEGEKLRTYRLETAHWEKVWSVLQRRQLKRQQIQAHCLERELADGSPTPVKSIKAEGDPDAIEISGWSAPESLEDVRELWEMAQGDPELEQVMRQQIPAIVFQQLGLSA
jgi:hypothetical protein